MPELSKLFTPGKIGKMEVRNRIVMPAMHTALADSEGYVTQRMIDYYAERAKGGVGLIVTGVTYIVPWAPGGSNFMGASDDKFIPAMRELARGVQRYGAKIAVQLGHHGTTQSEPRRLWGLKREQINIVAPSAIPYIPSGVTPRELSREDIRGLVEAWAQAARRVKEAGFDAVQIHGAHGYLINQFLSPFFNKRQDEYGGSLENRARFPCEVLRRMREMVGPDFPILIRMNGDDGYEGGIRIEDAVQQARLFQRAGADAIDLSAGCALSDLMFPSYFHTPGLNTERSVQVKMAVNIPVITVGKIGDPLLAESILREAKADFIAMGRALLADPELPNKAREGRLEDIRRCIYCENCHATAIPDTPYLGGRSCTVNPALTREAEFMLTPASPPKKVMVIGGGLAGMEAAILAAQRGHEVTLYERDEKLGGQWNLACQEDYKAEFASLRDHLVKGLGEAGVKVVLNQEVTIALVEKVRPDAAIVAIGANPTGLDIPGAQGKNVVQANDVLAGKVQVGDRVVVIGGRWRAMDAAIHLAERGKKVSLVARRQIGRGITWSLRFPMRNKLIESGVYLYPYSYAIEIGEKGVNVISQQFEIGEDSSVRRGASEIVFLKADTVVLAVGAEPNDGLAEELKRFVPQVLAVGDCIEPRDSLMAMKEGAEAGRTV